MWFSTRDSFLIKVSLTNINLKLTKMEFISSGVALIIFLIVSVCGIIITRLLGAWMLRINEVIQLLRFILLELKNNTKA